MIPEETASLQKMNLVILMIHIKTSSLNFIGLIVMNKEIHFIVPLP